MEKTVIEAREIIPTIGYFQILKNGKHSYDLIKGLTKSMDQNALAEFYEIEKQKGNPIPTDSIGNWEIIEDAVNSNNNELKDFVGGSLRDYWIQTLSRAAYNPEGQKDEAIHKYGTSDVYTLKGNIVGKDSWIEDLKDKSVLELLLKNKDVKSLNRSSNEINGTSMYAWRINSKPKERDERVVGLGSVGGRLGLGACGGPSGEYPAFLVLPQEK